MKTKLFLEPMTYILVWSLIFVGTVCFVPWTWLNLFNVFGSAIMLGILIQHRKLSIQYEWSNHLFKLLVFFTTVKVIGLTSQLSSVYK